MGGRKTYSIKKVLGENLRETISERKKLKVKFLVASFCYYSLKERFYLEKGILSKFNFGRCGGKIQVFWFFGTGYSLMVECAAGGRAAQIRFLLPRMLSPVPKLALFKRSLEVGDYLVVLRIAKNGHLIF